MAGLERQEGPQDGAGSGLPAAGSIGRARRYEARWTTSGRQPMRISIFGLGYVGSVSAARFAEAGCQVTGVDVTPEKVAMINAGRSPIVEPGLEALLQQVTASGHLHATTS